MAELIRKFKRQISSVSYDSLIDYGEEPSPLPRKPNRRLYHLVKQKIVKTEPVMSEETENRNIFQRRGVVSTRLRAVSRPVGGSELYNRIAAKRLGKKGMNREFITRMLNSEINLSQRHSQTEPKKVVPETEEPAPLPPPHTLHIYIPSIPTNETYRQHALYAHKCPRLSREEKEQPLGKSVASLSEARSRFGRSQSLLEQQIWSDRQAKAYHDKMALLGEIKEKRSLGDQLGERAFELSLRDRYKEELQDTGYIYQLGETFTTNRVIARLRSKSAFKTRLQTRDKGAPYADTEGQEPATTLITFTIIHQSAQLLGVFG